MIKILCSLLGIFCPAPPIAIDQMSNQNHTLNCHVINNVAPLTKSTVQLTRTFIDWDKIVVCEDKKDGN